MAHRNQIKQICRPYSKDTENRAYEIDQQIRLACRDGSGFAIPLEGRIGVAAIAVYLASEQYVCSIELTLACGEEVVRD